MRRRELIALVGGAAALPWAAGAQRKAGLPRVGIIDDAPLWEPFRQRLSELGYRDGQSIVFEYRTADGVPERLAAAAVELVRTPVDVIAVFGTPAAEAARRATTSIPIVAISVGAPVASGLVQSLARPGGNVTGNTILGPDIVAKRLELLKEAIPTVSRVAFLWNAGNASNRAFLDELQLAAPRLGLRVVAVEVGRLAAFDATFAGLAQQPPDALIMTNDPFHQSQIGRIIEFLAAVRLPGMFQTRENVAAGGLMSYGASLPDLFRRGALYVDKILRGVQPRDLPVEQPTTFELVINLQTAKALGLTFPVSILARADEVIE